MNDQNMLRFRCHVGHAFSAEALSDGQSQMLEVASLVCCASARRADAACETHRRTGARSQPHTRGEIV